MDKPKTLSEQLTELSWRAHEEATFHNFHGDSRARDEFSNLSAELRTMAERVKGHVLMKPDVHDGLMFGSFYAYIRHASTEEAASSPEEATANLQSLLDEQGKG